MELTWMGHSCFVLEQDGYRVAVDPYTGVPGYPKLAVEAHQVVCSHGHDDHHAVDRVKLLPPAQTPFSIRTVQVFHDDAGGARRGENTIHIFTAGGVSVAHLGDLGHLLSPEQVEAIGKVDMVLVPVGGFFTIDARAAKTVCDQIAAPRVVPMHYRHKPYGLPAVGPVDRFLELWPADQITRLTGNTFPAEGAPGVIVPVYPVR